MRRRLMLVAIVGVLALGLVIPGASAGSVDFRAPLSHAQEVGVINAPGAHGMAAFVLDGGTLHYQISVKGLTGSATQAHIHAPAVRGVNTGIEIWLCGTAALPGPIGTPTCSTTTDGSLVTGSVAVSLTQLGWMETMQAYVNVHTAAHPGGEVRGQVLDVGGKQ